MSGAPYWLSEFFVHTAAVEEFMGTGSDGHDSYGAPVNVPCFFEGAKQIKRSEGDSQVLGAGTLYCAPGFEPLFTPDSRVTIGGVVYRAAEVNVATLDSSFPEHMAVKLV